MNDDAPKSASGLDGQRQWLAGVWRRLTGDWKPLVERPVSVDDLDLLMKQASLPYFGFYFMMALATIIATFGLLANSAATIIGAMIIAPLMYPIMSLSFGIVVGRRRLLFRSAVTLVTGVLLVIAIAFASTELLGLRIAGSEILSRTRPTLLDLGVALAAGGASAFAYTRRSVFSAIAGVAIAVALVPPLAVAGIGLALGREGSADTTLAFSELGRYSGVADVSAGAFTLFLTNLSGIVIVAASVFLFHGYGHWKRSLVGILLATAVAAGLIWPLGVSLRKMYVKSALLSTISTLIAQRPDLYPGTARFESVAVDYKDGLPHIDLNIHAPEEGVPEMQARVRALQQHLAARIGEQVILRVEVIPIKILEYEYPPSAARAGAPGAAQDTDASNKGEPASKAAQDPSPAQ